MKPWVPARKELAWIMHDPGLEPCSVMNYLTFFLLGLVAIAVVARPAVATMFPYPVHRTTLK
ncbi:MAG: hypothetical protein V3T95_01570, partial [Acidobacteriota bacterium]